MLENVNVQEEKERQAKELLETLIEFSKVYAVFGKGVSLSETEGRIIGEISREWFQNLLDVEMMIYNQPKIRVVRVPFKVNYPTLERRVVELVIRSQFFIEKSLFILTELNKEIEGLKALGRMSPRMRKALEIRSQSIESGIRSIMRSPLEDYGKKLKEDFLEELSLRRRTLLTDQVRKHL